MNNEQPTTKRPGRKAIGRQSWVIRIRPEQRQMVMQSVRMLNCVDVSEWIDKVLLKNQSQEQMVNSITTANIVNK